ncbi:hypothetical protein CYY_005004 [Polysphondylium violaceum]|uniref:SAC domain-containing protein n=1 Tax=Polysphondylium violaceum TaxID=133409 RepID=A0A8J4PU70_9MYCE|nr:hypothetical protein CYY_005004 [Polysphondylium violaceum]
MSTSGFFNSNKLSQSSNSIRTSPSITIGSGRSSTLKNAILNSYIDDMIDADSNTATTSGISSTNMVPSSPDSASSLSPSSPPCTSTPNIDIPSSSSSSSTSSGLLSKNIDINNNNNNNEQPQQPQEQIDEPYQPPTLISSYKASFDLSASNDPTVNIDEPILNYLSISGEPLANGESGSTTATTTTTSTSPSFESNFGFQTSYHDLHQIMYIYVLKEKIIVKPERSIESSNNNSFECLVLDRINFNISSAVYTSENFSHYSNSNINMIIAYGIVGIINLLSGPYLVIITERALVGQYSGLHNIYRIENCNLLLIPHPIELSEHEKKMESTYKKSLKSLLKSNFYFCFQMDLSHTIQRNSNLTNENNQNSSVEKERYHLYETFDNRFYWNKNLQISFIFKELYPWILPLIRGYVEIVNFKIENSNLQLVLVSRRSKFRAGTRYNTRGSDLLGNVANYVETEQILSCNQGKNTCTQTFSFVQTRGSIPLLWEQTGRKIKPEIKINVDLFVNKTTFKLHFDEQIKHYGPQTIVTLLDSKGSESELGDSYKQSVTSLNNKDVDLVAFDFHHFCQGGRFDRVDILIENLSSTIEKVGYLSRSSILGYITKQEGIVRTNCLDCLDRTNLVQSMIGINVLEKWLHLLEFEWKCKDTNLPGAKQIKLAWANNGDAISFQYAGTGALKGDYTRTGKRNTKGKFKDGVNSLTRYYINTFLDKMRQVSIDLFLGSITVETNTYKFQNEYDWGESRMAAINNCVDHFLRFDHKEGNEGFINAWIVISINKRNQEQERILLLTPTHLVRCKYNFNENKIVHFKQFSVASIKKLQIGSIKVDNGKKTSFGIKIFYKPSSSNSIPITPAGKNRSLTGGNESELLNNSSNNNISPSNSPPTIINNNNNNQNNDTELLGYISNQYIIPIPEGETIEFGKDLVMEISDTIKDCHASIMGYANINQLSYGSSFVFEQDFKRKTNSFVSAAYNGLKLGFYSKSPTVSNRGGTGGSGGRGGTGGAPFSASNSNSLNSGSSGSVSNNHNSNNNISSNPLSNLKIDKRRSKSFSDYNYESSSSNNGWDFDRTMK